MGFDETKEMTAVLLTTSKINVRMHSNIYQSNRFKPCMMIDDIELYMSKKI